MATDIAEKIKAKVARRKELQAFLETNPTDKELDEHMKWTSPREKSVLFAQLKDLEMMPVKFFSDEKNDVVNGLIPLDDYAEFQEQQKQKILAQQAKAKKPKNPQGMRAKADAAVIKAQQMVTKRSLDLEIDPDDLKKQIQLAIANLQYQLARIKQSEMYDKLIEVLELKDRAELDSIHDLNSLVE